MGVVRRLLVVLLLGLMTVVVVDGSAHATCTCEKLSLPQKVAKASAVFSGTLTMASGPTTTGKRQILSYDVEVDTVYKGEDLIASQTVTVRSDADERACGLTGLIAEGRYLFFVRAQGANANLLTNSCSGTGPATNARTQRLVALLGQGTTPVPPTPDKPVFESVEGAEPPSLTRIAAPGAAMLLVGLLGLMVFGALGRSRKPR
jgi:hypothetical protein